MVALDYQIEHFPPKVKAARQYNLQHLNAKRYAKEHGLPVPKQKGPTDQSVTQYINHSRLFGHYCMETHQITHWEDCRPYIQDYCDDLVQKGYKATTIHTWLAGICFVWDVPLSSIKKPLRHAADTTRSRGKKKSDCRKDRHRTEKNAPLHDFFYYVGIRNHDDIGMRKNQFVKDESGYWCVLVRRGKGGKRQKQRILPNDLEFVRPYFDGSREFVFSKEDLKHRLDIHHLRALHAQRAYAYYTQRLAVESGYRKQLIQEIQRRWAVANRKKWDPRYALGTIHLRGCNRAFAKKYDLPLSYDRLAVLAVSVFHLSHWRTNVAISHYLLAYSPDENYHPTGPEDVDGFPPNFSVPAVELTN